MRIAALIVAAGRGLRAGGDRPKQFQHIAGRQIIEHTLAAFQSVGEINHIVVVLHRDKIHHATGFENAGQIVAIGEETRSGSVLNGLKKLASLKVDKVLIHDAARPGIHPKIIREVIGALDRSDAAAPGLALVDALWTGQSGVVTGTMDRNGLYRAQTPQGFDFKRILAAYQAFDGPAADDVEVARAMGMTVTIVPGHEDNFKITTSDDFIRAERILRSDMDIRMGNGFDVHAFGPGDHVTLCGVNIPFDRGLVGHSDADVAMHALTDAIYGALAEGDIGRHFPPSDPQWKDCDSRVFLKHAVALVRERKFKISNTDLTLVCEFPKITPVSNDMRRELSVIMDVNISRVSVKATTSEQLGFTGRGEGIAAMANVTLVRQ